MTDHLTNEIRNLCNHPWKRELLFQDKIKWNKLWTSMDAIGDTQIAIDSYLKLPDFDSYNGGYLYIYGIMQALNIQQDAANNLLHALFNRTVDYKIEYPNLYEIREHRNNAVGHPTNRGNDKSFHLIGRSTISKKGFSLASYFPKTEEKSKFEKIDIMNCIQIQNKLVTEILKETMDKLQLDFEQHKLKFKGQKLSNLIHNNLDYHISKLYENIERDYPLTEINFNSVYEVYEKIKKGVIERYFSLEALQGLNYVMNILDYIFTRLKKDLVQNKINDKMELTIFIDALRSNFTEFQEMITEIDKEFE
jgi:hypothetical protein